MGKAIEDGTFSHIGKAFKQKCKIPSALWQHRSIAHTLSIDFESLRNIPGRISVYEIIYTREEKS